MTRNKYFTRESATLLVAIGMAACSGTPVSLGNGRDAVDPLPTNSTIDETCVYAGKEYDALDSFPASDGCNTCTCDDGSVVCTEKACGDGSEGSCNYGGSVFADGATFDALDGCNTCGCEAGSVACTKKACEQSDGGCDFKGEHFSNGDKVPSSDCNSSQCVNGAIATTMKACEPGSVCSYKGEEYALGAAVPAANDDGCTKCSCETQGVVCTNTCGSEDPCVAGEKMCIAGGGDPSACKEKYTYCNEQPAQSTCDETYKACIDVLPADGDTSECKTPYEKCLGNSMQQPAVDPCTAALTACQEKLPVGSDATACKDAYVKCSESSGGSSEPLPANPSQCDSSFSQCAEVFLMSGGNALQCKDAFVACASHQVGVKLPSLDSCIAERDACEADDLNGCEMYFDECVQRVGQEARCESTFDDCLSGAPELADAIVCKDQFAKCAPFYPRSSRPTRDECLARRAGCESKGKDPACVVAEQECLDLVLPTAEGSCEVDGVEYRNGDRLPGVDCNVLRCVDGKVLETVIACEE